MRNLITLLGLLFLICQAHATVPEEAKLLTYNVLADKKDAEQRLPKLFQLLEESKADIIALQEVAPWFIKELIKQKWVKSYHFPNNSDAFFAPRGLLILSKSPITKVDFKLIGGKQSRGSLTVETKILGESFTISTCHLESFLESGTVRAKQMETFFKQLKEKPNAIFLGDFNFGDGEAEEKIIPTTYKDCWLTTNPKQPGFTWDIELSPMAKQGSFTKETSRRLDRVLLKSEIFKPVKSKIIGNASIKGSKTLFPSDHFGLLSVIQKRSDKK